MTDPTHTLVIRSSDLAALVNEVAASPKGPGDLNDELLNTAVWSDAMVARAGIPVRDVPFVTIGGGIGSFVMADHLRVAGVPVESIANISNIDKPFQTYEYLTRVSQIPRQEVLRSDSTGCPDSVWAWPSYAYRAALKDKTLAPIFSVTVEPIFTDYWTPKAGQVFEAITKESARIGYERMLVKGNARMVRKREGGGYFVLVTPPPGSTPTKRIAVRCRWVHIAVGYPGLRFLPDLQEYRQKYNDFNRVVNAYEPHEGVYEALRARPGVVLVRGGGIVASRILQRLMEDRWNHGAQTTILHLFRTFTDGTQDRGGKFYRRKGGDGWSYQGFNWPKGAWGGQLKDSFDSLEGDERKALYQKLGGTHTPKRKLWQVQMAKARAEGWYNTAQGEVKEVVKDPGTGRVITRISSKNGANSEIQADFVIDATGLEADISEHRLLEDLLKYSGAGRNPMGRLDVERYFEVRGTRSGEGRMYASGAITLGGYYCGVDSFLGLQYAALRITDELSAQGFGKYIGVGRSMAQWWKWARGKSI
jgi:hypothetical protein